MAFVELYRDDCVFTAYVTGVTAATAGCLLIATNHQDAVTSSGKSSLADNDIWVQTMETLTECQCVGIATEDCATTGYVGVSTKGLYIMRAGAISTAGYKIVPCGGTDKSEIKTYMGASSSWYIGKALTGASAADAYMVCLLDVA
jgi:hypothetical protein